MNHGNAHFDHTTGSNRAKETGGSARRWIILAALLVLMLATAALGWGFFRRLTQSFDPARAQAEKPVDPRLQYAGPFQNIHPEVPYVGDAACLGCHRRIVEAFRRHPMGHSIQPIASVAETQPYDKEHHDPFQSEHSLFLVEREGNRVWHRQRRLDADGKTVFERSLEVHYTLGSGARGYSYLSDRDGYLFQTPISWFTQKQIWDLSPGMDADHATPRPVTGSCLFCHANRANFRTGTLNHYDSPIFEGTSIGCERCHGPGAKHVALRKNEGAIEGADYSIVNPRRLEPALREAVCQQCHLDGEARVLRRGRRLFDYRPGLPLDEFWRVFVFSAAGGVQHRAVNHVEQMYQSRCFRGSDGQKQLGCTSCHDPHERTPPEQRAAHYRDRCLKCHQVNACSAPAADRHSKKDSCIACHMPPYADGDIAHTAATDHRILRRPTPVAEAETKAKSTRPSLPLVPFPRETMDLANVEMKRDAAIGLTMLIQQGKADALYALKTVEWLQSLPEDPADADAWEALGSALLQLRRERDALAAFEKGVAGSPDCEPLVVAAAKLRDTLGEPDQALSLWQRAVTINPWMASYRGRLATALARNGDWPAAGQQCEAWLRLAPESIPARQLWISCLVKKGEKSAAQAEFAKIEALQPTNLRELRAWFANVLHAGGLR